MNLFLRLAGLLAILFDFFIAPILWLLDSRRKHKVTPINHGVLLISATELAKRIRTKQVSAEYVTQTFIDRILEVNPVVNAISEERFSQALQEARDVDYYLTQNILNEEQLARFKPFYGVPITLKESCALKDLNLSVGSIAREGIKAPEDSEPVRRLRNAGFIPLLVSTCPEYCVGLETINLVTGCTKNPYNTNRTSGGSSGGEAVLLSSGASVVGLGTDFAGSIRIPCQFNGIFGHKATPRIVPRKGFYPDTIDERTYDYFSIGPMTRYAEDMRPILQIITGEEGLHLNLDKKVDLRKIRVFYSEGEYNLFGINSVQSEIVKGIEDATDHFNEKFGVVAKEVYFEDLKDAFEISTMMFLTLKGTPNFLENPKNPKRDLNLWMEFIKNFLGKSRLSLFLLMFIVLYRYNGFIPRSQFSYYKNKMERLKAQFIETLGEDGVFIYPSFPSSAFQHYQIFTKSLGVSYSMIFNILGCPSSQVPIGFDTNNLPVGIQVVAAPHKDGLCLAVAEELEKRFGGWIPPPFAE